MAHAYAGYKKAGSPYSIYKPYIAFHGLWLPHISHYTHSLLCLLCFPPSQPPLTGLSEAPVIVDTHSFIVT